MRKASINRIGAPMVAFILSLCWIAPVHCADFKDALGREIKLGGTPRRIISLAPSLTEILFFLGLGDKVIGVTQFSSYPPEADLKPKVGTYINLNIEKIISLAPDLVIGTVDGNEAGPVGMLEEAGLQVFIVDPRNVEQVIETVSTLGHLCGVNERAAALSRMLQTRVDHILEKTGMREKPLVFLQINLRPIITVNRHTYHHDLIQLAGGINMTQNTPMNYPRISLEEVIRRKPEVILISSMERGGMFEKARTEWMKWTSIPAVQKGRVHLIDSDLIDRPSPRIVAGLEAMARFIHPGAGWN